MAEQPERLEQIIDHQNSPSKPIPYVGHNHEDFPSRTANDSRVNSFPLRALVSELNVGLMLTRAQILFYREDYVEFEKTITAALSISNALENKNLIARCCFWQGMFLEKISFAQDSHAEHGYAVGGVEEEMIKSFQDARCILPSKDLPEPPWPESRWLPAKLQKYNDQLTRSWGKEGFCAADMSLMEDQRSSGSSETIKSKSSENDSLYNKLLGETKTPNSDVPQPGIPQPGVTQPGIPQPDTPNPNIPPSIEPFEPMSEFMQRKYGIRDEPLPNSGNTEIVETPQQIQEHSLEPKPKQQENSHNSIQMQEWNRRPADTSPPDPTRAIARMSLISQLSSRLGGNQRTESVTDLSTRPLFVDSALLRKQLTRPKHVSGAHSHRRNTSAPTHTPFPPRGIQRSRTESLRKPSDMTDTPAHVERRRSITKNGISPGLSIDTTAHTVQPRVPSTPIYHSPLSKVIPLDDLGEQD